MKSGVVDADVEVLMGRRVATGGHQSRAPRPIPFAIDIEREKNIEVEYRVIPSHISHSVVMKNTASIRKAHHNLVPSARKLASQL
jgi:hypothetical protein